MKKILFNNIYNFNCIDGMKLIPKNKIDLVIT
ncbi:MAG: site-specific DNA-methyltransferase, partial [Thermoproteota archaeon]|nr:site-specific DNA-methyltransferase [Thermoproteota archaeon]